MSFTGFVLSAIGIAIITLLLWIQTRQRDSIHYFQRFFRENPTPMWVLDVHTLRFLSVNRAAQASYGYSKEDFQKLTLDDIRARSEHCFTLEHVLTAQRDATLPQVLHRRSNGEEFHVTIQAFPTMFRGREALIVQAVSIEDRLLQERLILAQNRQFREIAWIQSHKVRAPLARLMGLVQIINTEDFADPNNELLLKYLILEARELDGIITEIVQKTYRITSEPETVADPLPVEEPA